MSGSSANKRAKYEAGPKKFYKGAAKNYLEAGFRGFLATTNFREKECVRECTNILISYADDLYGTDQLDFKEDSPTTVDAANEVEVVAKDDDGENSNEDEDIATTLENELKSAAAANAKNLKKKRFQPVSTGASNCVFIKTTLRDPVKLGVTIIRDVADNRKRITRNVLRFVPVEAVCKANMLDMKNAAGKLFDKYFLNAPATTYSIVYNRRCNNDLNRDEIIRELASLVETKSREHKVDLKSAHYSVLVEIVKGLCCLSVLPDYLKNKKYNLAELMSNENPASSGPQKEATITSNETEKDTSEQDTNADALE